MNREPLVYGSLGLLAAYTLIQSARNQRKVPGQTYKQLWAIGALALALGSLADVAPQVAGPFALMLAVGGIAANEGLLGGTIQGAVQARVTTRPTRQVTGPKKGARDKTIKWENGKWVWRDTKTGEVIPS